MPAPGLGSAAAQRAAALFPRVDPRAAAHVPAAAARQPADRPRRVDGDIIAPTLVLHGEDDPFFPIGNGEALAAEIPDARLVRLGRAGHRLPAHAVPIVAEELIAHTAR
jgi:pimeloyl-ACP methyl ester carboxylesterase